MLVAQRCTGTYFQVVPWSAIEPNVGVASACLPSSRPIFKICINSIVALKELFTPVTGYHRRTLGIESGYKQIHFSANMILVIESGGVHAANPGTRRLKNHYLRSFTLIWNIMECLCALFGWRTAPIKVLVGRRMSMRKKMTASQAHRLQRTFADTMEVV